jgi:hypothetical protein
VKSSGAKWVWSFVYLKQAILLNLYPEPCKLKKMCTFVQHYLAGYLFTNIVILSII